MPLDALNVPSAFRLPSWTLCLHLSCRHWIRASSRFVAWLQGVMNHDLTLEAEDIAEAAIFPLRTTALCVPKVGPCVHPAQLAEFLCIC